jgi:hypothetical protein
MINLRSYFNLPIGKLLKIKLKSNPEYRFGIFDSIGFVQPKAATPVEPTSPVNFRYWTNIES